MSQEGASSPNKSLLVGIFIALLVLAFFFGRQCKKAEVIVQPLNDDRFKQMEAVIKDSQKAILDSIKLRYSQISIQTQSIYVNHKTLQNDLSKIGTYTDRSRLVDSLLFSAGYR